MDIKTKRSRFEIIWEVVIIDGQVHFLVKDVLKFFGLARSSQGTVVDRIQESDKMMLKGEQVRSFKNIKGRGMVISRSGLADFIVSRTGEQERLGQALMSWIDGKLIPDIKGIKAGPIQEVEKEKDLLDILKDQDIEDMKRIIKLQSERLDHQDVEMKRMDNRIKHLEGMIKKEQVESMIHEDGGRQMVDVDALINHLQSVGPDGRIR